MKWFVQTENETYDDGTAARVLTRLTTSPRPRGDKVRFAHHVRPVVTGGYNVVMHVRPARRDELPAPQLVAGRWLRTAGAVQSYPL